MSENRHTGEDDWDEDSNEWPSVDDVKPSEEGGPIARKGFNYQDEVAVSFLLDMMQDPSIIKIHCETHDDITIVSQADGDNQKYAEYVQVKATSPDQLWTISKLCQTESGKDGTSVFERSFAHDRHKERSRFRILTLRQVSVDLSILTRPVNSVGRELGCEGLIQLKEKVEKKRPDLVSPKGNTCAFWLDNCFWDVRNNEEDICNRNKLRVFEISAAENNMLLPDSIESLLDDMRRWVKGAGAATWNPDREKKIITREKLTEWWKNRVTELTSAGTATGGKVARKMKAANLPSDVINLAIDLRRSYSRRLRSPRYSDEDEVEEILDRVKSEAASLRSSYLANLLEVDSLAFHSLCLERMDVINNERSSAEPDQSSFLKGCLYDITDRCLLRFDGDVP